VKLIISDCGSVKIGVVFKMGVVFINRNTLTSPL